MGAFLIYGSYGYTGRLIAREAVSRGIPTTVAGRDGAAVTEQAAELGVDGRTFDLEDGGDVAAELREFDAVLNCAGPFVETAEPIVEACLEAETDYLDITGEFPVFERLRGRDDAARSAGVTLLPGVGFDVVPTDCLAAFLHELVPSATALSLGIKSAGPLSRGTARTAVEHLGGDSVVRRNGRLLRVPMGFRTREIDFGDGPEHAVTIPWGDVVTAAHTTGIDSIEVYAAAPSWASTAMHIGNALPIGWVLESEPVEDGLKRLIDAAVDGPDERALVTDRATVWGEIVDDSDGRRARARLETPNPYALTVETAVNAAERVLGGRTDRARADRIPAGFQTPASAFGAAFVLECSAVERELLESPSDVDGPTPPVLESDAND